MASTTKFRYNTLLSMLPATFDDGVQWLSQLKSALKALFSDIDRITISAMTSPVWILPTERPIAGYLSTSTTLHADQTRTVSPLRLQTKDGSNIERLITNCMEHVDLRQYHRPVVIELVFHDRYVGAVLLFRKLASPPISQGSLSILYSLKPFIEWSIASVGCRRLYSRPTELTRSVLSALMRTALGLTVVDNFILTLLLSGYSYKQTAETMGVTIDTVKKHMKKVYSRAGVGSLAELWTKYYPQRWDDGCSCAPGNEFINGGTQRRTGSHDA